jgi:hypothetical protein
VAEDGPCRGRGAQPHRHSYEEGSSDVLAAGVIQLPLTNFLKQLTTFHVEGPTEPDRWAALARFGELFLGKLWDVYATSILCSAPF